MIESRHLSHLILLVSGAIFLTCSADKSNKSRLDNWVGQKVDLNHIRNEKDSFVMFNTSGEKVGGMLWEKSISETTYIHKDVSYFDDGSVYEEAIFSFSLNPLKIRAVQMDMKTQAANAAVDFQIEDKNIKGPFTITRDTSERIMQIDSVFDFDVVRSEIYSMIHSLEFEEQKEIPFNVLSELGLAIAKAKVTMMGREKIDTGYGEFQTIKLDLNGGGVIPDNTIWINESPRRIVKVHVPGPDLDVILVKTTSLD